MEIIPVSDYPTYSQEITLDNVPFIMLMSWNTREQCWTLTFMDHDENVLVAGIKIVLDAELLRDFPDRNLPAGALVAISDDESKIRIGRHDLGVDVSLIYASEEEVDAII